MVPCPRAQGLTLCDYVMREEGTRKLSLVGTFGALMVTGFPSESHPFWVFVSLTDGLGEGNMELTITQLSTDEEIFAIRQAIRFPDRFADLEVLFRLDDCSFPEEGPYLFTLLVDDVVVAQRRVPVYSVEETT